MEREQLLRRVKRALKEAFPDRLSGVVMYGSEARGEAEEDSDLDLLVLLNGPVNEPGDSWACINALYPLVLESGRPIHAEPVATDEYRAAEFPLFQFAAQEGVLL